MPAGHGLVDEIIRICTNILYHTDITPPEISEDSFYKLMLAATKGKQFSYGELYVQTD